VPISADYVPDLWQETRSLAINCVLYVLKFVRLVLLNAVNMLHVLDVVKIVRMLVKNVLKSAEK
jgi:hypothetical protein